MAVAVSGAFVSCKDDVISGSTVEQKIQAFEEVFTEAFGKPDPNHTWGFGDPIIVEGGNTGMTRSVNVNGNLWETQPEVTDAEALAVYNYVNKPKKQIPHYYEVSPINLKNFFVTQVWGSENNSEDENCHYTSLDNNAVFGPGHMDNLQISTSNARLGNGAATLNATWDHINNFNASSNRNFGGNTMFVNWGTQNFAYMSSEDSKYHDKWIIIDGADIGYSGNYYVCFDFLTTNDQVKTNFKVEWVTQRPNPNEHHTQNFEYNGAYTIESAEAAGLTVNINGVDVVVGTEGYTWSINSYVEGNKVVLPNEYYTDWIVRLVEAQPKDGVIPDVMVAGGSEEVIGKIERQIITAEKVVKSGRIFCEDIVSNGIKLEDLDYNDVVFDAAIVHNYSKLVSTKYNNDGSLIPSTVVAPNPEIKYVFNEVVNGKEMSGYSDYYAKVCVLAAGGTLPIELAIFNHETNKKIYNKEVHDILGGKGTSIMINTLDRKEREIVNMAQVESYTEIKLLKRTATQGETLSDEEKTRFPGVVDIDNDIQLNVNYNYGNVATNIKSKYYKNDSRDESELVASAKFMVPLGTRWAKERTNIKIAYPKFQQWVNKEKDENNEVVKFWESPSGDSNFYINNDLISASQSAGLDPETWAQGNFISPVDSIIELSDIPLTSSGSGVGEPELQPATNRFFTIPDNTRETVLYNYDPESPGYLYNDENGVVTISKNTTGFNSITTGSTIRIYGVSIAGFEINTNFNSTAETAVKQYSSDNSGYVEIPVTDASVLGDNDLVISGKNFTVTYVSVVGSSGVIIPSNAIEIWTGSEDLGYNDNIYISSGYFRNASERSQLLIVATATTNEYKQINIQKPNWGGKIADVYGSNDWNGSCTFTIGSYLETLQQNNIVLMGGGLNVTKVYLIP